MTSTSLVPVGDAPRSSLAEKITYASKLADADLLPAAYRKKPGNILLAIEMGESIGVPAITAINLIHVIEGKPSASSALISALVRRAGHRLRVTGNDQQATAQIVRCDDPDFTFSATWTLDRAKAANLTGKGPWKSYPAAMLKARAITECARDACQEALCGVQYTPEELGADVDSNEEPVVFAIVEETAPTRAPASNGDGVKNSLKARLHFLRSQMDEVKDADTGATDKDGSAAMCFARFERWVAEGKLTQFPTEGKRVCVEKLSVEELKEVIALYESEQPARAVQEIGAIVDDGSGLAGL